MNVPLVNTVGGTANIEGRGVVVGDTLYDRKDNIYGRTVVVVDAIVKKNFAGKPSLEVMAPGWPDSAPCVLEDLTWKQPMDSSFVKWYTEKYGHDPASVIDPSQKADNALMHEVWTEARKDYYADIDARGRMATMLNLIRQMCESTLKVNS